MASHTGAYFQGKFGTAGDQPPCWGQGRGAWPEYAILLNWTCRSLLDLTLTRVSFVSELCRGTC